MPDAQGNVKFMEVVAQIKLWLNNNKTTPSASCELEGTKAVRSASFQELCIKFAVDLGTGAFAGDSPLGKVLGNIGTQANALVASIPGVGSSLAGAFSATATFLKNPLGSVTGATNGFVTEMKSFNEWYSSVIPPDLASSAVFSAQVTFLDTLKYNTYDLILSANTKAFEWAAQLAGTSLTPSGYSMNDALAWSQDKLKGAMSVVFGTKEWDLKELAGTITDGTYVKIFNQKVEELTKAQAQDLSDPDNLAAANEARKAVEEAATALAEQIDLEQRNYHQAQAQFAAIQSQFDMANYYSGLSDVEKSVYLTTLDPAMHENVQVLAAYLESSGEPTIPDTGTVFPPVTTA